MNSSPERGSFHIDCEMKQVEEGLKTPEKAQEMIEFYKSWDQNRKELEATDEWKKDNMEYDLRSSEKMCNKAKLDEAYAQNIYAALCNNEFQKNDVWPLLSDKRWSCSWRSAGGIVANMVEKGDYIDWYCSGIKGDELVEDEQFNQMSKEQQEYFLLSKRFVNESVITEEIRQDLFDIGWIPIPAEK